MPGKTGGKLTQLWVFVLRDSRARPPYTVAADKSTRNEFRRFMEKNRDAYDYNKARVSWENSYRVGGHHRFSLGPFYFLVVLQYLWVIHQVPGPLTQEMEARQATRKKEQKAARRQREQQQLKQREQEEQELEERRRFAALSDREKVRLALQGFHKSRPPVPRLSCVLFTSDTCLLHLFCFAESSGCRTPTCCPVGNPLFSSS